MHRLPCVAVVLYYRYARPFIPYRGVRVEQLMSSQGPHQSTVNSACFCLVVHERYVMEIMPWWQGIW